MLDCYDVKNSQKRWRSCVLKKKQSKKVKKHITINGENIKKYQKSIVKGEAEFVADKFDGFGCEHFCVRGDTHIL